MSTLARLSLRLLGIVLVALGFLIVIAMIVPGPQGLANWMGNSCAHETNGPSEQCSIFDVLSILAFAPFLILGGAILALVMRPSGAQPMTIDLSARRR
jgi:hypothetical protein